MLDICPGDIIKVVTTKGQFMTNKLVIAAGSWSPAILKGLGLELPFQVCDKVIIKERLY